MRASQHASPRLLAMQQLEFRMSKRAQEISRRIKGLAALHLAQGDPGRWRRACERTGVHATDKA
jgi:hypothetical protein